MTLRASRAIVRRQYVVCVGLIVLAVVLAIVQWPAGTIESHYSRGAYAWMQPPMTAVTNTVGVSSLDLLAVMAAAWIVRAAWRVWRGRGARWPVLRDQLVIAGGIAAGGYVAFVVLWGLNYQRVPLPGQLDFDPARVTTSAVHALASASIDQANALRRQISTAAHGQVPDEVIARGLAVPFAEAASALGLPAGFRPGRPKVPVLGRWFKAAGVSGMTNPFGLETLLAGNLLPFEKPLAIAHEWGHLAGLGPESDASLVAFLTCVRGGPMAQYSAWLDTALRAIRGLPEADRAALLGRLSPEVVADVRAMGARSRRDEVVWLRLAAWDVYDRYLRAHRVAGGVRSYDQVITLLVGIRFDPGWVPGRRSLSRIRGVRLQPDVTRDVVTRDAATIRPVCASPGAGPP